MIRTGQIAVFAIASLSWTLLTGCTSSAEGGGDPEVRAILRAALDEGTPETMSAETREVIRDAADKGEPITYEQVRDAQRQAIACVEDLGFQVIVSEDSRAPGGLGYVYGIPGRTGEFPEAMQVASEKCESMSVSWLAILYSSTSKPPGPDLAQIFEPYRAAMIECVRQRGGTVADDAQATEVLEIAYDVGGDPLCVVKTGLDRALNE